MQAGATEQDLQALRDYFQQRRQLQQGMVQKLQQLMQAARGDDAAARAAVMDYRDAMQTYRTQRQALETDLLTKLALDKKPRLEALLLSFGILDNGGVSLRARGGGRRGAARMQGQGARQGGQQGKPREPGRQQAGKGKPK